MLHIPKYTKLEIERRFLVDVSKLPPLNQAQGRLIDDLYLEGSRLRLRSIQSNGVDPEYKLCKKYGSSRTGAEPVVNIYLSAEEHALLGTLPGFKLRKRRFRLIDQGVIYGINVFENALENLILAEVEAVTEAEASAIVPPYWAICDVTDDLFYTGGNLCRINSTTLAQHLQHADNPPLDNLPSPSHR